MQQFDRASPPHPFSPDEALFIARVAGKIIGPCEELGLPGADDHEIVARILQSCGRHEQFIRTTVQMYSAAVGGDLAAASLTPEVTENSLRDFAANHRPFAELLMCLVAESYYQDGRVLLSLNMSAQPPFPKGNVVEQGDWSLLDPVKAKDPIYRRISEEAL